MKVSIKKLKESLNPQPLVAVIAPNYQQFRYWAKVMTDRGAKLEELRYVSKKEDVMGMRFTHFVTVGEYWKLINEHELIEYVRQHTYYPSGLRK